MIKKIILSFVVLFIIIPLLTQCAKNTDNTPASPDSTALTGESSGTAENQPDTAKDYYGTVDYYSTVDPDNRLTDSFYFSDQWFFRDPAGRNDSLALASMQLTAGTTTADIDGPGAVFLKEIGFDQIGFEGFDERDPEGCNYIYGIKNLSADGDNFTLVALAIQSYSQDENTKEDGWTQNFTVNGDKLSPEHFAYAIAADKATKKIAQLGGSGPKKYWITGQSRGGALADMIAKRLTDAGNKVYTYTFEAPAQVETSEAEAEKYTNIHNYLCSNDIVTMVPPWGMTRYGVSHKLDTRKTNSGLKKELKKIGSGGIKTIDEGYDAETVKDKALEIMEDLKTKIPSREEYSKIHKDTLTDSEGNTVTVTYSYQKTMTRLMDVIFRDEPETIDSDHILDEMDYLIPAVSSLVKGIKNHSDQDYYDASLALKNYMKKADIDLEVDAADLYVYLKLVGSEIVDADYEGDLDSMTQADMLECLKPALDLGRKKDSLIFSHHFDTLIARLKVMAGLPAMEDLDVTSQPPKAGDQADVSAAAMTKAFNDSGLSWMNADTKWITNDDTFKDNKNYYLRAELKTLGHNIPKDLSLTINGQSPEEPLSVSYRNGVTNIRGIWKFTFGKPDMVTISFETDHGDPVKAIQTERGTLLKYAPLPKMPERITDQGTDWTFDGWEDQGSAAENALADEDLTLTASWIE